ncbi:MAG: hypothetical protein LBU77_03800 [Clostridiales bacterium]|jgi:hypothetical protein|nr:hypothetical protein [Clostridiales bacterium]
MSLFDAIKSNKKRSSRQEIGANHIEENGVETYNKEFLAYFIVKPLNIAVLSESNIRGKILSLMNLLKEIESMEIACINSRETFEDNKIYFKHRLENERSPKVREILEKDAAFLDRIQIQTASAREFLIILRFKDNGDINAGLSRMEKLLKDQGFIAKRAEKEDIKRIFAVYFVQNLTQVYFDDYDGERFVHSGSSY